MTGIVVFSTLSRGGHKLIVCHILAPDRSTVDISGTEDR